ncbi:hypothetical protein P8452_35730 [Trifolium repens]|nr:hypothetical protein P8452_35730 [Trifolium repens]
MAEGLLFNMIEKLIGKLGSVVVESWNMRDDLEKLVENMSEIKAVVLDAEEQLSNQQGNYHQLQLWLANLKDALEDAEDLLDEFNTEELRRQVMTNDKKAKKFRIFFSSSNQLLFSFKMAGKIQELEAKHTNLMEKPHLHRLTLLWKRNSEIFGDVNDLEKDDIILHDIVMHSNIKVLHINGFGGVRMSGLVNLSTNLDKLKLHTCPGLQYLELGQLHVKHIRLQSLPSLEWIVNGDNSSTFCASLKEILLIDLHNLKGWCRCSEEQMSKGCCHQFKSLDRLFIFECRNLISFPQHKDIKNITVSLVTAKILQQAVTHSNVEFLDIGVIIHNFRSLCGVLQHLTRLCELSIDCCDEFDPCKDEDGCYSMKWKELTNLKVLTFRKIPKMKYLPEGLQHITTLQTLKIRECVNLTSLPEWVTSLQVLDIKDCPKSGSTGHQLSYIGSLLRKIGLTPLSLRLIRMFNGYLLAN